MHLDAQPWQRGQVGSEDHVAHWPRPGGDARPACCLGLRVCGGGLWAAEPACRALHSSPKMAPSSVSAQSDPAGDLSARSSLGCHRPHFLSLSRTCMLSLPMSLPLMSDQGTDGGTPGGLLRVSGSCLGLGSVPSLHTSLGCPLPTRIPRSIPSPPVSPGPPPPSYVWYPLSPTDSPTSRTPSPRTCQPSGKGT